MRLGAHMSVTGGKYMALVRGKELGCEAIQVFIRNVRGWSSGALKQEEIGEFLKKRNELKDEIKNSKPHSYYRDFLSHSDIGLRFFSRCPDTMLHTAIVH